MNRRDNNYQHNKPYNNKNSKPNARQEPQNDQATHLAKITIKGFKSLKNIEDFTLKNVNILIGANGVGKSNFLSFFDMLGWMVRGQNLQEYISFKGGGDDLLFKGAKNTRSIECLMKFGTRTGDTEYGFALSHTEDNRLIFTREEYRFTRENKTPNQWDSFGVGHDEAKITSKENRKNAQVTKIILQNCAIYQFHDTSAESPLKLNWDIEDTHFLKGNGQNLASILYHLQQYEENIYQKIISTIRLVLPVFKDFELKPIYGKIRLRWITKEINAKSFGAHLTSDGTLRFFALVTLLCLPKDRTPDVVLLDEPELGLHPYAISLIAELIKRMGKKKQVIVATQSPLLLNEFKVEEIVVANMSEEGATELKRLDEKDLLTWLEDYQVGDLWQKNIFGGNPV